MREQLLPQLGMTLIADHPFNDDSFRTGSERAGPDLLVRTASGEFRYVEVKWWIMVDDAIERAKKQASSDFRAHREYEGIRVVGAHTSNRIRSSSRYASPRLIEWGRVA